MVEKWLRQVEDLMLRSVRHVIYQGLLQYTEVFGDFIFESVMNLTDSRCRQFMTILGTEFPFINGISFIKPAISSLKLY